MIRHTLIALVASCGLFAGTEIINNTASAAPQIKVGVFGKSGGVSVGFGGYYPTHHHGWYRPYYPASVYYPTAPMVYTPPPIVVAPAVYDVYYRYFPGDAWRPYATFTSHAAAHIAMDDLRLRGFESYEVRR